MKDRMEYKGYYGSVHFDEEDALFFGKVESAQSLQSRRLSGSGSFNNAGMSPKQIKKHCELNDASEKLIKSAMEKLGMSARAYSRTLKVARTIADLAGEEKIETEHLAEAIQYRAV